MDPITIGAIIAGAKTGMDVVKQAAETITSVRTAAKSGTGAAPELEDGKLAELSNSLIEARIRTLDLLRLAEQLHVENAELRDSLLKKDRFREIAGRYVMQRFPDAGVFYSYVPVDSDPVPPHAVCPNCFEDERITHLQVMQIRDGHTSMNCPTCGTKVLLPNERVPKPLPRVRRSSSWMA